MNLKVFFCFLFLHSSTMMMVHNALTVNLFLALWWEEGWVEKTTTRKARLGSKEGELEN